MQMNFAFAPSMILASGVQLGVFSQIAEGRNTAPEIARAAGATERGVRMLLDALTGLELLRKVNGAYELTPLAEEFLVRGKPSYMGAVMEQDRTRILDPWLGGRSAALSRRILGCVGRCERPADDEQTQIRNEEDARTVHGVISV
jgi:hypothetical protein